MKPCLCLFIKIKMVLKRRRKEDKGERKGGQRRMRKNDIAQKGSTVINLHKLTLIIINLI